MKNIEASVGAYAGRVGGSVLITGSGGRMIGQIVFICHTDEMRGKDFQQRLSQIITNAINEADA